MATYLHIPKTGGTALKTLKRDQKRFFDVSNTHQKTITSFDRVMFGIRDPWQRFCSGFWEAKTAGQRIELAKQEKNKKYVIGNYERAKQTPKWCRDILNEHSTPEEFFCTIYDNDDMTRMLYDFDSNKTFANRTGLGITTQSLIWWLGDLAAYQQQERRVVHAIQLESLDKFMLEHHGIHTPKEPFRARTRKQFDFPQSYHISDENLAKFKQWRAHDYELIEYIKQQPYYYN